MTGALPVALVQAPPVFMNLAATVAKAVALIDETARAGARLIVFPETWLSGYPVWLDEAPGAAMWGHKPAERMFKRLFDQSPKLDGPELDAIARAAAERRVEVVMGLHERAGGSLYNTMLFVDTEGGRRIHRKLTPTYNERLVWAQGDGSTLEAFPREYGVLGGLVCWEHWMPLVRAAMHAQHEAVHVAQWPAVTELHQIASRQYAFEGQCFVLASGCVMTREDVLEARLTVQVDGSILAHAKGLSTGARRLSRPQALLQTVLQATVDLGHKYLFVLVPDRLAAFPTLSATALTNR